MKRILLLATGDVLAYDRSSVATGAQLVTMTGVQGVTVEDVLAEPSWDTSVGTMLGLARRARSALLDDGFDGVVITHGFDTLEDTAFLTDLLLGPATPRGAVVFTGAARGLDDPKSDGLRNLTSALVAAGSTSVRGAGAVVCVDEVLHAARWVTLGASGFVSNPVLGHVSGDNVELVDLPPRRPPVVKGEPETDVAVIKTYPGMNPALLNTAVDTGARGIVLEGTGAGNVPVELFTAINEYTGWNIPVVITSRVRGDGRSLGAELAGKVGAISARGMSATQARYALMVALASGGGVDAARKYFETLLEP